MKKLLIAVGFFSISCFAQPAPLIQEYKTTPVTEVATTEFEPVEESFGYVHMGLGPAPLPLPDFGIGFRKQSHNWGYDVVFELWTIYALTSLKLTPSVLYYSRPDTSSQFYSGFGLANSYLIPKGNSSNRIVSESTYALAPQFIFGKKYKNENGEDRFFQVTVDWPTHTFKQDFIRRDFGTAQTLYFPIVYLKYGVAF